MREEGCTQVVSLYQEQLDRARGEQQFNPFITCTEANYTRYTAITPLSLYPHTNSAEHPRSCNSISQQQKYRGGWKNWNFPQKKHLRSRNIQVVGKFALSRLSSMLPAFQMQRDIRQAGLESFLFVISTFVSSTGRVEIKPEIHLLVAKTFPPQTH